MTTAGQIEVEQGPEAAPAEEQRQPAAAEVKPKESAKDQAEPPAGAVKEITFEIK